ncbi:MAG: Hsp70 family protein [Verrucomicrobiae bacterium]|nr:Hsp70 family protein [Verrucomicrobiae bacterium]
MNTAGIDFGTSTTLVACWNETDRRADLVHLGRSGPELPTTIHVDKARQMLFGDDADDQLALDPGGYQRRIKLGLGTTRKYLLNGHEFSAVDLCARFLEHVRHRVETEHLHGKLDRAVIAVPAKFGPAARQDLENAARQAGFTKFELIDEPVAAGIAFLEEKKGSDLGKEILVFDWGGGTLDIALVERKEDEWILNHDHLEGDPALGGEDIDDTLIDAVNNQLVRSGQPSILDGNSHDYPQIYRRVVETKKLLSKKEQHSFSHSKETCRLSFDCTREEFEHLIAGQVTRAMQCVTRWKERAGGKGQSIRNVLLIGGTSQIPVVSKHLQDLGLNPIPWTHGMRAVAMGAALRANRERSAVEKAESGDTAAMIVTGQAFLDGTGVDRNPEEAFRWFKRAAEAGSPEGMYILSKLYLSGRGTKLNYTMANLWRERAGKAGHESAKGELKILSNAYCSKHENPQRERSPSVRSTQSLKDETISKPNLAHNDSSKNQKITQSKTAIQENRNSGEKTVMVVLGVVGIVLLWVIGVGTFGLGIPVAIFGTLAILKGLSNIK